jgi:hypothetical protein
VISSASSPTSAFERFRAAMLDGPDSSLTCPCALTRESRSFAMFAAHARARACSRGGMRARHGTATVTYLEADGNRRSHYDRAHEGDERRVVRGDRAVVGEP